MEAFKRENPVLVSAMRKACSRHRRCEHMTIEERAALDEWFEKVFSRAEHPKPAPYKRYHQVRALAAV